MTDPSRIAVILGSTREGRFGEVVAHWVLRQARLRDDISVDFIDLAEVDLPAAYPDTVTPEIQSYLGRIDAADGFVIVTPEYNHAYPASLKQALDIPGREWRAKPVAFVSYGGLSGGLRAVEQLRPVISELHAVPIRDTVSFHLAHRQFDESGELRDEEPAGRAAATMLDQLVWWSESLKQARATRPYLAA